MGLFKIAACVVGGVVAVAAAPLVVPVAVGAAAVAATAATAAGAAVAGSAIGGAVIGAAGTAAAAAAGAATAAGAAVAGSTVGGAVIGAASTAAAVAATAATATGAAVAGSTVGGAVIGAAGAAGTLAAGAVTSTVGLMGASGVTAAIGAGLSYSGLTAIEGFENMEEAKEKINEANRIFKEKTDEFEIVKNSTTKKLEKLSMRKMEIYAEEIPKSIDIIKKIKVPKETDVDFNEKELDSYFTVNEINEFSHNAIEAKEVLNKVAKGASLLKSAAGGSLGFMSTFGVASTGTAISSLSGAAASNAALAALGGGSLSVGGGGMALGRVVLGGISIVPTAMIFSYEYAKNSEKQLTEAERYYSKVRMEVGNIDSMIMVLQYGVDKRIGELFDTLERHVSIYSKNVYPKLLEAYKNNKNSDGNVDYTLCSQEDQDAITLSAYYLRKIKELIAVKILDADNNISKESEEIISEINSDKKIQGVQ